MVILTMALVAGHSYYGPRYGWLPLAAMSLMYVVKKLGLAPTSHLPTGVCTPTSSLITGGLAGHSLCGHRRLWPPLGRAHSGAVALRPSQWLGRSVARGLHRAGSRTLGAAPLVNAPGQPRN